MAKISDGTSNTFAVGEQSNYRFDPSGAKTDRRACNWDGGPWSNGNGGATGWWLNVTVVRSPINSRAGNNGQHQPYLRHTLITSAHTGGAHLLAADGSVHFISENINFRTFTRLLDKSDDQPVGEL